MSEATPEYDSETETIKVYKTLKYTTNMSNIIVAKIHNSSLGKCVSVDTIEDGKQVIRDWFYEQFSRSIDDDETDSLEDELEIYNDEDSDNHYTFSIGILEE